ncbi:hypothetical protein LS73_009125 [Helicobacter muridarum]|uniref:Radical SAM domain-containing protein n=1 Tax=Helicobacter muridarum TaxID=216 RepID=A0A099TXM3_9HELI|nr:hypothetical protein [Helicobacter muridarum]TLD98278.1 hypothetical protein LS73_009125 [Helicobacter muridarum]STQ85572.1 radical SAM domain-containing protein [Helicobacter muridarum]
MSLINEYEILSRSNDIPLAKTAGRFFFEKLLSSFELSSNKEDILALFRDISNKEYQRLLFAKFIGIVNIETSGFCNRKCSYCPVGLHGRHDRSLFMKSEIFNIILENLRLLGFESSISLNGYNEPLLDPNISMHIKG